jgi:predicted esterase
MMCRQNQNHVVRSSIWAISFITLAATIPAVQGQQFRYVEKVVVEEPTKLDWVYAHLGTSPPAIQVDAAQMTARGGEFTYEFYGPVVNARIDPPLVIFVSPQDRPVGWDFWADVCESHGAMFAGIRDAGNGVSEARRVRAVLEVLSDIRRRHGVSPERTYLAGFSGGAHVAWRVACALPEQFGGVVCIGYAPQPPRSAWQRTRLAERISVAIISGDRDPATPWIEALYGPMLEEYGVRTVVEVLARHGHTMPQAKMMDDAFVWLELASDVRAGDVKRRIELNIIGATSREKRSSGFLGEAQGRLRFPDSTAAGLATLAEIVQRWPDLPAASEAQTLLDEYDKRADKPWLAAEQRQATKLLRIEAAGYERLARQNEPTLSGQRAALTAQAKQRWEQIALSEDAKLQVEANERLAELKKWAARTPAGGAKQTAVPLGKVRFEFVGEVTLAEGVERFQKVLAQLGYALQVDKEAAPIIAAGKERIIKLDLPAASFSEVDRRFFRRHGLKLVRKGNEIQLLPMEPKAEAEPSR